MKITNKLIESISDTLDNYTQKLTKLEKKQIHNRINTIKHKYDTISNLKKSKTLENEIDPMFFCFENLPTSGKEYWFMKFITTKPNDKRQIISMFGSSTDTMKINGINIDISSRKNSKNGFMTSWFFDNKKHLIFDDKCNISVSSNKLISSGIKSQTSYTGSYPNYNFNVVKNNKNICSLKITPPNDGSVPFEFSNFFKGLFGYALINLYFNFTGTLNNKTFEGKCYIQKVIVIGPFLPWYWGRVIFSNGSFFTYYTPHINLHKFNYKIRNMFKFYDNETKKTYYANDVIIEKYGLKFPRWIITNKNRNLFISMNSYSSHKFTFKRFGTFTYDEYLAHVNDIYIEGKKINLKKLGTGIGLVEDAKGFIF